MFWLQIVKKFIQILRAGQTPRQLAAGFALARERDSSKAQQLSWLEFARINIPKYTPTLEDN